MGERTYGLDIRNDTSTLQAFAVDEHVMGSEIEERSIGQEERTSSQDRSRGSDSDDRSATLALEGASEDFLAAGGPFVHE
jgi:hypothetical protein